MYYFYGNINWGHTVCPLYEGGPYLEESVMDGSTATQQANLVEKNSILIINLLQRFDSVLFCTQNRLIVAVCLSDTVLRELNS